jgi:hypothetical protein
MRRPIFSVMIMALSIDYEIKKPIGCLPMVGGSHYYNWSP